VSNWVTRIEPGLSPWWRYNWLESIVEIVEFEEFDSMNNMKSDYEKKKKMRKARLNVWEKKELGFTIALIPYQKWEQREFGMAFDKWSRVYKTAYIHSAEKK
jgi:hypothetical protein